MNYDLNYVQHRHVMEQLVEGQKEFLLLVCRSCGLFSAYRRELCHECNSNLITVCRLPMRGVVAASTIVRRSGSAEWIDLVPYTIGLIEVAKGVRLLAASTEDVMQPGDSVSLCVAALPEGRTYLKAIPLSSV